MTKPLEVVGADAVEKYLLKASERISDRRNAYRKISVFLRRSQTEKITKSRGKHGALAPVQRWTRIIANNNPNNRVLVATGQMRRDFNTIYVSNEKLVFGPRSGPSRDKAVAMVTGQEGKIRVNMRYLRSKKDGSGVYVRIKSNDGNWYTKQADDGFVSVKPRKRKFIFTSRRDRIGVRKILKAHIREATK